MKGMQRRTKLFHNLQQPIPPPPPPPPAPPHTVKANPCHKTSLNWKTSSVETRRLKLIQGNKLSVKLVKKLAACNGIRRFTAATTKAKLLAISSP